MKNREQWDQTKADERLTMYGDIVKLFDGDKALFCDPRDSPSHWWLMRELAFGSHSFCECCNETHPTIMCYAGSGYDTKWEESPEADVLEEVEDMICAWCVADKRAEKKCSNCGCREWKAETWVLNHEGERVKMPTPCFRNIDGEGVEFFGHDLVLVRPYQEAGE